MIKLKILGTSVILFFAFIGVQNCATSSYRAEDGEAYYANEAMKKLIVKPSAVNLQKLVPYFQSENTKVRTLASIHLASFSKYLDQILPALEKALQDPEPAVRRNTAFAVLEMGKKGHPLLPVLRKLISDPDEDVSTVAYTALGKVSAGKEGGCGLPVEPKNKNLSLTLPEIPADTALVFGNVGCAYTNDAIRLVKKMNLKFKVYDLYGNSENMDIFYAYLYKLKVPGYGTIPVVIYDGQVFERPQKDGDIHPWK